MRVSSHLTALPVCLHPMQVRYKELERWNELIVSAANFFSTAELSSMRELIFLEAGNPYSVSSYTILCNLLDFPPKSVFLLLTDWSIMQSII